MPSVSYNLSIAVPGISNIVSTYSRSADSLIQPIEIPLAPGKAGQLTTRTDNASGTFTMTGGHGITTGQIADVYWVVGGVAGRRYGVTIGTVATNSVPFSSGSGDNLPVNNSNVVVCVQTQVNVSIDGDAVGFIAFMQRFVVPTASAKSHVTFKDSGAAVIAQMDLAANIPFVADIAGGASNPFTGNPIVAAFVSNGDAVNAATFLLGGVVDSTP